VSKRHFEEAARIVRQDMEGNPIAERLLVARYYARLFTTFNSEFNRAQFFVACGLPEAL
jgi:hypothetical protein